MWLNMEAKTRRFVYKIIFHQNRYTVASLLMTNRLPPKDVQHQIGHSTITMTMDLYAHYIQKEGTITGILYTAVADVN